MKGVALKKKLLFFIFLICFIFFIFQFSTIISPKFFKFSTKSAITSAKFSLLSYYNLLNKNNQTTKNLTHNQNSLENSNNDEFAGNEENLFKQQIVDFEPPFLVGPAKINFSPNELNQFNENDGPILRNCYGGGTNNNLIKLSNSAYVKNLTKLPNSVVLKANDSKPSFKIESNNHPQVLIIHTHTTEAFELKEKNFYSNQKPSHSLNFKTSVVGISEQIVKQLEQEKIGVIHDKTVHDSPSYTGAYDRSNKTIRNQLANHPSIKVVLDIHRDGIQNEKNERIAPVVKIDGRKAAQIMIISGCDNGTMHYPNYEKNLAFACFLQKQLEADYPNITRPLLFKYKHYNQSLTPGTLLIEIGSNSNSVDEANYASWLFGKALAKALNNLKN